MNQHMVDDMPVEDRPTFKKRLRTLAIGIAHREAQFAGAVARGNFSAEHIRQMRLDLYDAPKAKIVKNAPADERDLLIGATVVITQFEDALGASDPSDVAESRAALYSIDSWTPGWWERVRKAAQTYYSAQAAIANETPFSD